MTPTSVIKDNEIAQDPSVITITTSGSTFTPVIVLSGQATVTWYLPNGVVSNATTLNVNWGTSATRTTTLSVSPWSAVQRLNFGYDAGDGGSQSIELVSQCGVTSITGLELVKSTIGQLCFSHNTGLVHLDLSDLTNLDTIECYQCSGLKYVDFKRNYKLARICLEQCALDFLDLSECPVFADIRGAINQINGFSCGANGKETWHICVQTNTKMAAPLPPTQQFPKLIDAFWWNCHQRGNLDFTTERTNSVLSNVLVSGNYYTSADFTGRFLSGQNWGYIDLNDNELASLTLTGCVTIHNLLANHNNLGAPALDGILAQLVASGVSTGTVDLSYNNIPSGTGLAHVSTLRSRGWTVTVDEGAVTLVSIAVTPNGASIASGGTRQYTATGTYSNSSTADITATATWTSSNESYVTVSSSGLAAHVSSGSATITATSGAVHGDASVTLQAEPATLVSIAVTPDITTVTAGSTRQMTATATMSDLSTENITTSVDWTSSDETHATIGLHTGLITGVLASSTNEVTITATSGLISDSTTLTVNAIPTIVSIAITPDGSSVASGATLQMTATATMSDSSTQDVTNTTVWSLNSGDHATISATGLVTGTSESTAGEVVVTATSGAISDTTTLTITSVPSVLTFTTVGYGCHPTCVASGGTVAWTLQGVGVRNTEDAGDVAFGGNANRTHTLAVTPVTALTQIRQHSSAFVSWVATYSGLSVFPNLAFFCEESNTDLTAVDFTNCSNLTTIHLAGCTGMTAEAMDNAFIALDAAVGSGSGQTFYYVANRFTSASATARTSLGTKGWSLIGM